MKSFIGYTSAGAVLAVYKGAIEPSIASIGLALDGWLLAFIVASIAFYLTVGDVPGATPNAVSLPLPANVGEEPVPSKIA